MRLGFPANLLVLAAARQRLGPIDVDLLHLLKSQSLVWRLGGPAGS